MLVSSAATSSHTPVIHTPSPLCTCCSSLNQLPPAPPPATSLPVVCVTCLKVGSPRVPPDCLVYKTLTEIFSHTSSTSVSSLRAVYCSCESLECKINSRPYSNRLINDTCLRPRLLPSLICVSFLNMKAQAFASPKTSRHLMQVFRQNQYKL